MLLALAGCDLRDPVTTPVAAPATAGPARNAEPVLLGSYNTPTRISSWAGALDSHLEPAETTLRIPPNSYALVRIGGRLELNTNPWLYGGGTPFGTYTAVQSMSWTAGRTRVWIREDGQVQPPAGGTEIVMQPDANGEDMVAMVRTSDRGATLWAGRVAVPVAEMFYGWCLPRPYCTYDESKKEPDGQRLYVEKYHVAQSHTVTATEYPEPLQIKAPAAVAPGQPVTVEVRGADGLRLRYPRLDTADVGWMWFPGDTAAVPNPGWPEGPFDCSTPVCTFTPREGGRMLVWTWVEGTYVEAWSDVIRVGNVDTCGPGAAVSGMGMRGAALNVSAPCAPDAHVRLRCAGDDGTPSVLRGGSIRCTVSKEPADAAGEIKVESWRFRGTNSRGEAFVYPDTSIGDFEVDPLPEWGGKLAISGTVEVRASVGEGPVETKTADVTVRPRDWSTLPLPADPIRKLSLAEYNSANQDALVNAYPDSAPDLGRSTHRFTAPPPSETFEYINDGGPNNRLAYPETIPIVIEQGVMVHPQMEVEGEFWRHQTGGQWCSRFRWPTFHRQILEHEGADFAGAPPLNPRSHIAVYRRELQATVPQILEGVVLPDSNASQILEFVVARARPHHLKAATTAGKPVDLAFPVPFDCTFNFRR
ncbi:MAG TPA: hypothetical protein VF665_05740 [Longimicrobium sp.]|jgi:hypothetical protein|uniref:hypothetical protein n=1 Tax=Longimicrobium sp. TaxID=2029185 RepID=UPI002EDB7C88